MMWRSGGEGGSDAPDDCDGSDDVWVEYFRVDLYGAEGEKE